MSSLLPPSIRVVVRGWLNCNQVVLRAPGANVLVDSGYVSHRVATVARHVMKVMFISALLDRGRMAIADVPAYLARIGCHGKLSRRFLGVEPDTLADWLVADLQRAGAIVVDDGHLTPTAVA